MHINHNSYTLDYYESNSTDNLEKKFKSVSLTEFPSGEGFTLEFYTDRIERRSIDMCYDELELLKDVLSKFDVGDKYEK